MSIAIQYRLTDLLIELYRGFDHFNEKFFENKLELPVIIVQSARKRNTLGTCSVNKIWVHQKETASDYTKYEITISAEHLNRPVDEICATLLHEMVHLHNGLNNIKDTSNNFVYHNKKFKEEAEKRGLIIEKAPTIGWSVTTLKPETKDYINSLGFKKEVFEYYRKGALRPSFVGAKLKWKDMTKDEKLEQLNQRLDKIKDKIAKVQIEG